MADILVTGAAGFIGANFVYHWLECCTQDRVIALDVLACGSNRGHLRAAESSGRVVFVEADILDAAAVTAVFERYEIEKVVHFAAETHVDRSITDPLRFVRVNVEGTLVLLEAARGRWSAGAALNSRRFHYVSTDEVYGSLGSGDAPFTEVHPLQPNSPYSASKAGGEHLARAYFSTFGLPVTISRCSNNYGPFQHVEKLIPLMIHNALAGKPLPVYGDGSNLRDWLFVADHCRGIVQVMARGRLGEVYNLGGSNEIANLELVKMLCAEVDAAFERMPERKEQFPNAPAASANPSHQLIAFVADRPGHDWRYALDTRKARDQLQFSARHAFADGLRQTVEWYLDAIAADGSYVP